MTTENPYKSALIDLRKKRAEIDNTIKVLEAMSGLKLDDSLEWAEDGQPAKEVPEASEQLGEGAFLGMSIVDAAKKLLATRKKQMRNREIADELASGGLVMNSADPVNTVGSVLTRRFNKVGDVVRVARGTWGLKEWYPNRTFKASAKQDASPNTGKDATQNSEQYLREEVSREVQSLLQQDGFIQETDDG